MPITIGQIVAILRLRDELRDKLKRIRDRKQAGG